MKSGFFAKVTRLGDLAYSKRQYRRLDTFEARGWEHCEHDCVPFVEKHEYAEDSGERLPKWPVRNPQLSSSDDD